MLFHALPNQTESVRVENVEILLDYGELFIAEIEDAVRLTAEADFSLGLWHGSLACTEIVLAIVDAQDGHYD